MADVELIEGADDVAVADWLHRHLQDALGRGVGGSGGEVAINVPGGSTPFPILALLARRQLDWARLAVWPGDDRLVAEDHPASNIGKVRALLEPCGARIVPLAMGAAAPHFALSWLGMGADGHIASLFPNSDPRADDPLAIRRITPDPLPPEAPFDRITLTIPALVDSDALLFVIRGADKRAVFEDAMRGRNDLPVARLLRAARGRVTCFT